MKSLLVATLILTATTAVSAQTGPTQEESDASEREQDEAQQPEQKNERRICRRVGEAATGSTLGHKRCLTAEQWRRLRR